MKITMKKCFGNWAAVLTLAVSLLIIGVLRACSSSAEDENTTVTYVKVAYSELETYLATASTEEINYIEVTGLSDADLIGVYSYLGHTPSPLGKKLKLLLLKSLHSNCPIQSKISPI